VADDVRELAKKTAGRCPCGTECDLDVCRLSRAYLRLLHERDALLAKVSELREAAYELAQGEDL